MEVSEVKQRLLTDFFTYYPMGGALYDKNGALIDINKSLNEKFPFTNEADFLFTIRKTTRPPFQNEAFLF